MDRHNESTLALPMVTRMRIMETHTCVSHAIYTRHIKHARTRACVYVSLCVSRENRPRSKACPWYIEPATISDKLFRKQWKTHTAPRWMNIQGLSNDWVSQKSGLLSTRDSSLQAHDGMQI